MEPEVKFVGIKLPAKTSVPVDESLEAGTYYSTLHITQFALAESAVPGRNVISLKKPTGERFVLGTLRKDHCEQFQADYMLSGEVEVINSGESEVHLTGYQTITNMLEGEFPPSSPSLSEDDEDFEEELAQKQLAGAGVSFGDASSDDDNDEDEEGESDEEEDDDRSPSAVEAEIAAQLAEAINRNKARRKEQAGLDSMNAAALAHAVADEEMLGSSSSGSEGDEDEDGSEDEGDDAPDLLPVAIPKTLAGDAIQTGKKKRANQEAIPPANKKAKVAETKLGTADDLWASQIQEYISKNGPTKLSAIGSGVKKPPGVTKKLKQLVVDSKSLRIGDGDVVSTQ